VNRRRYRVVNGAIQTLETVLLAALLAGALVCAVGALSLLPQVQFGPPVGEIVTFRWFGELTPSWHVDAMQSSTNRHCILKPAIMAATRGSMVVERRMPDGRTFLAHWAGGPTSDDARNCGSDVDLTIGLAAMQTLLSADAKAVHWYFVGS
jgi:hypothetical protein